MAKPRSDRRFTKLKSPDRPAGALPLIQNAEFVERYSAMFGNNIET